MFLTVLFVTTTEGKHSYYVNNYSELVNALVAYDKAQMQTTGNATYNSYWIKLIDAEGNVLKEEKRDLTDYRTVEESAE